MTDPTNKQSLYEITYFNHKEFCTYIFKVFGDSPDDIAGMFTEPDIEIYTIRLLRGPVTSNG